VPTARVRWRTAGSGATGADGWNDAASAPLTVTDNGAAGISVAGTWNTAAETRDAAADTDLNDRSPVLLDVQVCLSYSSGTQCTWSPAPAQVLRVPHAFGDRFPVAEADPGEVAPHLPFAFNVRRCAQRSGRGIRSGGVRHNR